MIRPRHPHAPEEHRDGLRDDPGAAATRDALRALGRNPRVVAELRADTLPAGWPWAVVAGISDALSLLDGREMDADALPDGSVLYPGEPILVLAGRYLELAEAALPLEGLLAQASGVATAAARLKRAAGGRPVYGTLFRRLHAASVPALERAAFVGGCDALSTVGASLPAVAEIDLAVLLGEREAWAAFDRAVPDGTPRVITVGAVADEAAGAVAAAEALGERLAAVRVDRPGARGEELAAVVRAVRWELDVRGLSRVRVLVAGDVDETTVRRLSKAADGFFVQDALAGAPPLPVAFDVVEVEGEPRAVRGRLSGRKRLWRCGTCGNRGIAPGRARLEPCPRCGGQLRSALEPVLRWGSVERPPAPPAAARSRSLREASEAADPFV